MSGTWFGWDRLDLEIRQPTVAPDLRDCHLDVLARVGLALVEEGGTCSGTCPAPAFHAASKAVRRELWDAYALFVAAYRTAAEKLRVGIRDVVFPTGSFPPPMPFVG